MWQKKIKMTRYTSRRGKIHFSVYIRFNPVINRNRKPLCQSTQTGLAASIQPSIMKTICKSIQQQYCTTTEGNKQYS